MSPDVELGVAGVSELINRIKFQADLGRGRDRPKGGAVRRVAIVEGAIGGPERLLSLAALFPNVQFDAVGRGWPDGSAQACDIVIVPLAASGKEDIAAAFDRITAAAKGSHVVVALAGADVMSTRMLIRQGAADVLPAPVTELSLTLCLERLLGTVAPAASSPSSQVVSFLKAGGGVGATSLIAQLAPLLAAKGVSLCAADLDLQFGSLGLYLDLPDAVSLADLLASGNPLDDTLFMTSLARHRSGAQVLAGPRDLTPLEGVAPGHVEALITGLRRAFQLTLIDLPSVWTAWTNRALHMSDRIVLVTQLSVAHINLVKRQFQVLTAQGLDHRPVTLVCNALSADQQETLTLKAAERALGRPFDIVLPHDGKVMNAAVNQGVTLANIRRATKLEKALEHLVTAVANEVVPAEQRARR